MLAGVKQVEVVTKLTMWGKLSKKGAKKSVVPAPRKKKIDERNIQKKRRTKMLAVRESSEKAH